MMVRVLNRYLLGDFLKSFLLAFFVLTFVMYMGAVVQAIDYMSRGISGLLHLPPQAVQSQVATTAPVSNANRATPWSAVGGANKGPSGSTASAEPDVGTSEADAIRMGPPAPTTKEVAALLKKARAAEGAGALLEPKEAIALYKQVLAAAPANVARPYSALVTCTARAVWPRAAMMAAVEYRKSGSAPVKAV